MDSNFIGKKFNRWTVLGMTKGAKKEKYFLCRCDCGVEKPVSKYNVVNSVSKSCGCFSADALGDRVRTHGESRSKEYSSWRHMIDRCTNERSDSFKWYGAIGITVCKEWESSFEQFLKDVGRAPVGKFSIDRIDPSKGYFPANVRWANQKTQSLNKKVCKTSSLGVTGVSRSGNRFRAYGNENGKQVHLGVFDTISQAINARKAWERFIGKTELDLLQETKDRIA